MLVATIIVVLQLPSAAPIRAMLVGEPLIQATVSLHDELILNRETTGQVEIWNCSSQPAKIIGFSRSCRCFDLSENPISQTIPATGRLVFPLVIKPTKLGSLHQRVELILDHPKQYRMNIDVFGSVKGVE